MIQIRNIGEDEQDQQIKSSLKLKSACHNCKKPHRYKCPECFMLSCSIKCVQEHKKIQGCSGKRKTQKFIRKQDYGAKQGNRDYNLLIDALRQADQAHRSMRIIQNYCDNPRYKMLKANGWRNSRISVHLAPSIFSRHRQNISFYFTKTKQIFWVVQLLVMYSQSQNIRILSQPFSQVQPIHRLFQSDFQSQFALEQGLDLRQQSFKKVIMDRSMRIALKKSHRKDDLQDTIKAGNPIPKFYQNKDWDEFKYLQGCFTVFKGQVVSHTAAGPAQLMERIIEGDENLLFGIMKNISLKNLQKSLKAKLFLAKVPQPQASIETIFKSLGPIKNQFLSDLQVNQMFRLIDRRLKHQPLQYIAGRWKYGNIQLNLKKPVFIPRPQTQQLVQKAIQLIKTIGKPEVSVLQLGSGSGFIPIQLASLQKEKKLKIQSIQRCKEAYDLSLQNLGLNQVSPHQIKFINADYLSHKFSVKYDLIIANPPYIPTHRIQTLQRQVKDYQSRQALDGGKTGVQITRQIVRIGEQMLESKGLMVLEIDQGQGSMIQSRLIKQVSNDQWGRERFIVLRAD